MKMIGLSWYGFVTLGLKLNTYKVGFHNEKVPNLIIPASKSSHLVHVSL